MTPEQALAINEAYKAQFGRALPGYVTVNDAGEVVFCPDDGASLTTAQMLFVAEQMGGRALTDAQVAAIG